MNNEHQSGNLPISPMIKRTGSIGQRHPPNWFSTAACRVMDEFSAFKDWHFSLVIPWFSANFGIIENISLTLLEKNDENVIIFLAYCCNITF